MSDEQPTRPGGRSGGRRRGHRGGRGRGRGPRRPSPGTLPDQPGEPEATSVVNPGDETVPAETNPTAKGELTPVPPRAEPEPESAAPEPPPAPKPRQEFVPRHEPQPRRPAPVV